METKSGTGRYLTVDYDNLLCVGPDGTFPICGILSQTVLWFPLQDAGACKPGHNNIIIYFHDISE